MPAVVFVLVVYLCQSFLCLNDGHNFLFVWNKYISRLCLSDIHLSKNLEYLRMSISLVMYDHYLLIEKVKFVH